MQKHKHLPLLLHHHYCTIIATDSSSIISNNLTINRHLRSGLLCRALDVFDRMPQRDAVSYNSMIAGFSRLDSAQRAMCVLKTMIGEGVEETAHTYPSLLSSCATAGLRAEGAQLHCRAVALSLDSCPFVASALIHLYMNTDSPCSGLRVFRELPRKNSAIYNSALRGLCELGLTDQLLRFLVELEPEEHAELNALSFNYLIRGCYHEKSDEGKQLHCYVIKTGHAGSDVFVSNALVDMYSSWGELTETVRSFDCIPMEDVISWNSVVTVFADHWLAEEALEYFHSMLCYGKRPSARSLVSLLNLSSKTGNLLLGVQIHGFVTKAGFGGSSVHVQSALIDMYGKCLDIGGSMVIFDEIVEPQRSVECYNSLITSLLHCSGHAKAIQLFGCMMGDEGARPDHVTLSAMIKAISSSSSLPSLDGCQMLHCLTVKLGLKSDIAVVCSLVSAYARAGSSSDVSCQLFNEILDPNVACFTALITAYARNGMGREGMQLFCRMIERGLKPDSITFLSVLVGCDHCGMVEEGISVFESMEPVHGIEPDRRHYSCMVSLLGRAGLLEEAVELMTGVGPSSQMWSALLSSCRVHGNEEIGRRASEALMELRPRAAAVCLQIASFYSQIDDAAASARVKGTIACEGLWREEMEIGFSSVEVKV